MVDEKYFLSDKAVEGFLKMVERQRKQGIKPFFHPTDGGGCARAITTTPTRGESNYIDYDMVDEKYYLSDRIVETFLRRNKIPNNHMQFYVMDKGGVSKAVMARFPIGATDAYIQDDNMTDKIEYLGNCYPERRGGESEAQEGAVYGTDGISRSIVATSYKGTMPKIITDNMQDKQVTTCAIRGRGESGNLHQSLEQGGEVANAVTTSHKDSMVMEIGNIYPATGNPQAGRIYDEQGISPALDTMEGGNRQPKILTPRRTEEGRKLRCELAKQGLQEDWHNTKELTPREDDCSNTLTSVQKDNLLLEQKHKYRIRRLTEREVFRLMNLEEKDIDTIQSAGISGTQQYKLAGNSVVTACWYHIMRKLFTQPGNEEQQLSLW